MDYSLPANAQSTPEGAIVFHPIPTNLTLDNNQPIGLIPTLEKLVIELTRLKSEFTELKQELKFLVREKSPTE